MYTIYVYNVIVLVTVHDVGDREHVPMSQSIAKKLNKLTNIKLNIERNCPYFVFSWVRKMVLMIFVIYLCIVNKYLFYILCSVERVINIVVLCFCNWLVITLAALVMRNIFSVLLQLKASRVAVLRIICPVRVHIHVAALDNEIK